jgi:hypothetical protein
LLATCSEPLPWQRSHPCSLCALASELCGLIASSSSRRGVARDALRGADRLRRAVRARAARERDAGLRRRGRRLVHFVARRATLAGHQEAGRLAAVRRHLRAVALHADAALVLRRKARRMRDQVRVVVLVLRVQLPRTVTRLATHRARGVDHAAVHAGADRVPLIAVAIVARVLADVLPVRGERRGRILAGAMRRRCRGELLAVAFDTLMQREQADERGQAEGDPPRDAGSSHRAAQVHDASGAGKPRETIPAERWDGKRSPLQSPPR